MNNVNIIGRLTKDAELKYSQSGTAVAKFTVAVNRMKKDETDFISCIAFNKTAENLANYTSKGSQIAVEGRIQTGSYEKEGKRIYTTDVIANMVTFLDSKGSNNQNQNRSNTPPSKPSDDPFAGTEIEDDSLPF